MEAAGGLWPAGGEEGEGEGGGRGVLISGLWRVFFSFALRFTDRQSRHHPLQYPPLMVYCRLG